MIGKMNLLMGFAVASVLLLNIFTFGAVNAPTQFSTANNLQLIPEAFAGANCDQVCSENIIVVDCQVIN